jgi:hypothetical protein
VCIPKVGKPKKLFDPSVLTANYSFNIIMATLLDSVENSIWHAFDYLALEGDGTATKVKLKVGPFSI